MLIREVTDITDQKLIALSEFLIGQADEGTEKTISIPGFIQLAQDLGINITDSQLRDLAEKPPLSNVIVNVTGEEVVFRGGGKDAKVTDTMTVTQAQDTVEKMANRAMPSDLT